MRPHSFTYDFPFCEAFEWMERSPIGEFIRSSRVVFPIVESIHLIGLALFVGTLLLLDMGLLGFGMRRQPVHQVAVALAPWTWSGFALLMLTGPVMFTGQAAKWHDNPLFWIKMLLLIIAMSFQLSVRRKIACENPLLRPASAKWIGAISLLLWISTGLLSKMMEFV
jgi:hypothetical protein